MIFSYLGCSIIVIKFIITANKHIIKRERESARARACLRVRVSGWVGGWVGVLQTFLGALINVEPLVLGIHRNKVPNVDNVSLKWIY